MEWDAEQHKYFITSDCDYRICKTFHRSQPIYTAWPPKRKPDTHPIGTSIKLDEAKKICEDHYKHNR